MRILWASADPVAEGSLGVTDRVEGARYLLGRGHDVTVICGATPGQRPVEGVPTTFVPARYLPFLGWLTLWPGVIRALRTLGEGTDAVVTDFALLPAVIRWAGGFGRSPRMLARIVLDVRTPPVEAGRFRTAVQRVRFGATLRRYGRRVDAVTAISPALRDHVAGLARIPAKEIAVWCSGSSWGAGDLPAPAWPPEVAAALRGRFVVLYHGSLSAGRGLFEAVAAVARASAEAPDLSLALLGAGSAVGDLRQHARRLGVEDRVIIIDPVPHHRVPEVVRGADVGLIPLPSKWEWELSSPLKLSELLTLGLPVVLTDIAAHRIVPPEAPFAFWAPSARPEDLGAAILRSYRQRGRLPALGVEARAWARPRLDWSRQFGILESVLTDPASLRAALR